MAGLSASEVAREASLSSSMVRRVEAAGEVRPDIALRYLLAIERYLQRRCALEKTIGGLVHEARDLVEEEFRAAEGEVEVTSAEDAVLIARRAVRRQRFLHLWRTRLESRAPGRPAGHLGSASLRRVEAREAVFEHQGSSGDEREPRDVWRVDLVVPPPPGFTGYRLLSAWRVSIDADTGRVIRISSGPRLS
jgi:transcriptional regulator with XRE-family HTH domain